GTQKIIEVAGVGSAGYRSYPRLARKHPYEGELREGHAFALCPSADKRYKRHIVFQRFGRKLRQVSPAVSLIKTAILVNHSRKESPSQRAIRDKTDAQFFKRREYLRF